MYFSEHASDRYALGKMSYITVYNIHFNTAFLNVNDRDHDAHYVRLCQTHKRDCMEKFLFESQWLKQL